MNKREKRREELRELLSIIQTTDKKIREKLDVEYFPYDRFKIEGIKVLTDLISTLPKDTAIWKKFISDLKLKELVLSTYAVCLFYQMIIYNHKFSSNDLETIDYNACTVKNPSSFYYLKGIVNKDTLYDIFEIGNLFGFTWDEVYNEVKERLKKTEKSFRL